MNLDKVVKCLKELGYEKLTSIQEKSLKELGKESARSLVIVAPTGSGKTEAAVFPVMLKIASRGLNPVSAIYVTPLRALNRDIERRLRNIGGCFGLNVAVRHGDTPYSVRKNIAKSPPHILVTTPETLVYVIINDETRPHLENLEYVIVDEFRDLVESKRGLLLLLTLHLLETHLNKSLKKVALAATLRNEVLATTLLSGKTKDATLLLRDPATRRLELKVSIPPCRTELCNAILSHVDDEKLAARVSEILEKARIYKHILVFTNTRSLAESLGTLLRKISEELKLGLSVEVHHGSLSRQHRERVERDFRDRKINILVSTSSLELGIDIGHVEYVIQYMSPRQVSRLLQRVGRSRHRLGDTSRGQVIVTSNALHLLEALVLASRAENGIVEEELTMSKPLDVLAYAVALYTLLNQGGVSLNVLYDVLKAHPLYSDLLFEELKEVVEYLSYARIIKVNGDLVLPTRKTRLYVYKTSMIPSTREVHVIEVASGSRVGVLDEEYVVVNLNPGDVIVLAGRPWRVVTYNEQEGNLYVEPTQVSPGEVIIPHWEGENIPVDYTIAREVGAIIRYVKNHGKLPSNLEGFLELGEEVNLYEQVNGLGDDETIYVDYVKEYKMLIINVYGGSRVNALIRDLLKYVLKTSYPYLKTRVHSTPYAIYVQITDSPILVSQENEFVQAVYSTIRNLGNYTDSSMVKKVVKESSAYLWRIYQVAQRFGAISPGSRVNRRLLEAFADTLIGKEALKEVLVKDYDIGSFTTLANKISQGALNVVLRIFDKLENHHLTLLGYSETPLLRELLPLDTSSFLEKLLKRRVLLLCLRCGYSQEHRVEDVVKMSKFVCPKCGFATLTLVKGDASKELEVIKKLRRGERLSRDEQRIHEDLAERAVLLYKHGSIAALVLSTPGVSTQEAARIINRVLMGSDLISELYEHEKRFIKVKKYLKRRDLVT